jgi:hypothetical protein
VPAEPWTSLPPPPLFIPVKARALERVSDRNRVLKTERKRKNREDVFIRPPVRKN